jgi:hypothetical protein
MAETDAIFVYFRQIVAHGNQEFASVGGFV